MTLLLFYMDIGYIKFHPKSPSPNALLSVKPRLSYEKISHMILIALVYHSLKRPNNMIYCDLW